MSADTTHGVARFALRPAGPLDAGRTLARYRRWRADPATVFADGAVYRAAWLGGRPLPYRLAVAGSLEHPVVRVSCAGPATPAVRERLRREARQLLGLDADLEGFYARVAGDRVLAPLVRRLRGLRPTLAPDPFEQLVGAILAQQVSLAAATAIRARLVQRFGSPCRLDGVVVHAFPRPETLAQAPPAALRALGCSARKARYLTNLARAVADGALRLEGLAALPDEAVVARLTALPGLGRWTAEWFLLRALGRSDVCPADDLGVRRAVARWCFGGRAADPAWVRRYAQRWRPYRSLAVTYLLAAAYEDRSPAGAAGGGGA